VLRRYASDEVATQSEPEADGATRAQHGDNSIAAASGADSTPIEPPKFEDQAEDLIAAGLDTTFSKHVAMETPSAKGSITDAARSGTDQATGTAQSAAQKVTDAAKAAGRTLSSAAGFTPDNGAEGSGRSKPGGEPSKTVYVGNLFFDVRGEDLKRELETAGPVVDTKIIMDSRGMSKGFVSP